MVYINIFFNAFIPFVKLYNITPFLAYVLAFYCTSSIGITNIAPHQLKTLHIYWLYTTK
jgi:hypothetical protein